jgi:hypothetical protein
MPGWENILVILVFMDEGTFEPTAEMLGMEKRTNHLIWDLM